MSAITLQDSRDAFDRYKKDLTDVSQALFLDWANFINRFLYRRLVETEAAQFVSETNYTAINGSQALPADLKNMAPKECGFFYVDDNGDATTTRLPRTGYGSRDLGYYLEGTNVVFTGLEQSETYTLLYIATITDFDDMSDYWTTDTTNSGTIIVDSEYMEYLIKAFDLLYTQWDEVPSDEIMADARFVRALSEVISDFRRDAASYGLEPNTTYF